MTPKPTLETAINFVGKISGFFGIKYMILTTIIGALALLPEIHALPPASAADANVPANIEGYLSYPDGTSVDGPFRVIFDDLNGGIDTLNVSDGNYWQILKTSIGVEEQNYKTFAVGNIFPNPANNGQFTVPVSFSQSGNATVSIYDISGRVISRMVYNDMTPVQYSIPVASNSLKSNMYIVGVQINGQTDSKKVIVTGRGNANLDEMVLKEAVKVSSEPFKPVAYEQKSKLKSATVEDGYILKFQSTDNPKRFNDIEQVIKLNNDTTIYTIVQENGTVSATVFKTKEDSTLLIPVGNLVNAPYGVTNIDVSAVNSPLHLERIGDNINLTTDKDYNGVSPLSVTATLPHGTVVSGNVNTNWEAMTDLLIRTYDVQKLKQVLAGTENGITGTVEINGKTYNTDANGLISFQTEPKDSAEVKVYSRKDNNADSYESFFWIPLKNDFGKRLNIPIVSYNSLSRNIVDSLKITPEVFKEFAGEGVFGHNMSGIEYNGFKAYDFGNKKYKLWIDAGQLEKELPNLFGTHTPEQQTQVADFIQQLMFPNFVRDEYKPEIVIASPTDTLPSFKTPEGYLREKEGYMWVVPRKVAPHMGFGVQDYNADGIMDAGRFYITIFEDLSGVLQEFNSMFVLGPINSEAMEFNTAFHERGLYLGPDLYAKISMHDTRLINMTQLMHTEPLAIREINGELFVGYKPKTDINRILNILQ